jgi:hypothetical protein
MVDRKKISARCAKSSVHGPPVTFKWVVRNVGIEKLQIPEFFIHLFKEIALDINKEGRVF